MVFGNLAMNLIKMEGDFLSVLYTLDIDFYECAVVSTLFTAFTNIFFTESDAFPKLVILDICKYSFTHIA